MNIHSHADSMTQAVAEKNPHEMARCTKSVVETGRQLIVGGQWQDIEELAISVDTVLAAAREKGYLSTPEMTLVADLAQQTFAVLQFVAHTRGERHNGNFIAARRQADRLDKMTDGQLELASLVELVPEADENDDPHLHFSLH